MMESRRLLRSWWCSAVLVVGRERSLVLSRTRRLSLRQQPVSRFQDVNPSINKVISQPDSALARLAHRKLDVCQDPQHININIIIIVVVVVVVVAIFELGDLN